MNQTNRTESYKALEKLYKEGKIRHIGVSNYTVHHLKHLIENCTVVPHVHQFELHPCLYQPELLEFCQEHKIQVQAYSSLGEGNLVNGQIRLPCLETIVKKLPKLYDIPNIRFQDARWKAVLIGDDASLWGRLWLPEPVAGRTGADIVRAVQGDAAT